MASPTLYENQTFDVVYFSAALGVDRRRTPSHSTLGLRRADPTQIPCPESLHRMTLDVGRLTVGGKTKRIYIPVYMGEPFGDREWADCIDRRATCTKAILLGLRHIRQDQQSFLFASGRTTPEPRTWSGPFFRQ